MMSNSILNNIKLPKPKILENNDKNIIGDGKELKKFDNNIIPSSYKKSNNKEFYFRTNKEKVTTTLLIVQGATDGNSTKNRSVSDVFALDDKTNFNEKLKELIENNIYKNYYFALDKDVKPFEIYNLITSQIDITKQRIHLINWNDIDKDYPTIFTDKADITDILNYLTNNKYKRLSDYTNIKTNRLFKFIKKYSTIDINTLRDTSLIQDYNKRFNYYISKNNIQGIYKLLIDSTYLKDNSIQKINLIKNLIDYILVRKLTFQNKTDITVNKYISEKYQEIKNIIDFDKKAILINAPAGSGKSYYIKELAKHHKILIISPLKSLIYEFENEDIKAISSSNPLEVEADVIGFVSKGKSLVTTTDKYINHLNIYHQEHIINYFDYIVFDEQHIIEESKNFRSKVINTYRSLESLQVKHNKKIIYLSGTPINNLKTEYKTIEIKKQSKTFINYSIEKIEDFNLLIANKLNTIKQDESLYIYTSTPKNLEELRNVILENDVIDKNVLLICSSSQETYYFKEDGIKVNIEDISNIPIGYKNIFIGTSKIATAVNLIGLKHIIQYGEIYSPQGLIQLYNRLRTDGTITVIPILDKYLGSNSMIDKAIGLLNAIKKLIGITLKDKLENPRNITYLKKISDIKKFDIDSFYNKNKQEFIYLASKEFLNIISYKDNNNTTKTKNIEILPKDIKDNEILKDKEVELEKKVNRVMARWGVLNIKEISRYFNTSQVYNIKEICTNKVKKIKTLEDKEKTLIKKAELEKEREDLIFKYLSEVGEIDTNIQEFLKDISLDNLSKIIDKSISDKKEYLNIDNSIALKNVRSKKDLDTYILSTLNITNELKEILNLLDKNIITVKELTSLYTQKGYKLKSSASNTNPFKSTIENFCLEIGLITKGKWKYFKVKRINNKRIYNCIYKLN